MSRCSTAVLITREKEVVPMHMATNQLLFGLPYDYMGVVAQL